MSTATSIQAVSDCIDEVMHAHENAVPEGCVCIGCHLTDELRTLLVNLRTIERYR